MNFSNEATATAPAQTVTVTEQLDPNLDWSTFQFGDIGFGTFIVNVPPGRTSFSTQVDATATLGVLVDITAGFNLKTGLMTWTFTSLDPTTLDLPMNPTVGFLPPNTNAPAGQGFVTYIVNLKQNLATGTRINAQATVVFDTNAPIQTAQLFNTIDSSPPTSSVDPLPATTTTTSFPVSWSGFDGAGSGVASYNVFVSTDGGSFTPFLTGTTQTSATFTGQFGHTYGFYSVASSNVGFVQPTPTAAQATTRLVGLPTSTVNPLPDTTATPSFTLSWSGSPGPGATRIASYEIFVSDNGGPFQPFLPSTTQTSATFTGAYGHTYAFYSAATDNFGDRQATLAVAQAATTVPALVTVTTVQTVMNKKHQVIQIIISFDGAVNAGEADSVATYHLATAGKKGSFTAKNAQVIKLKSALYNPATDKVTLTPKKAFTLTKPVQLLVYGMGPTALQDIYGRAIDGGQNVTVLLSRGGATINAIVAGGGWRVAGEDGSKGPYTAAVDAVLEREGSMAAKHTARARRSFRNDDATNQRRPKRVEPLPRLAQIQVEWQPPLQPWSEWAPAVHLSSSGFLGIVA